MNIEIKIFSSPQTLADALALYLVNLVNGNARKSSPFTIALSGGNTPKLLFSVLGDKYAESADWSKAHFFWVDERCVPPDHRESNFGMTNGVFFSRIEIPQANIHRIRGEDDPDIEAERYSKEISDFTVQRNGFPCFNVILLGLGVDGHTASVFPGNEKLFMSDNICETAIHLTSGQKRITITGKVINNSARIVFQVTGKNKAEIVDNIIGHGDNKNLFPASYVKPADGRIIWYLDTEAASLLKTVQ